MHRCRNRFRGWAQRAAVAALLLIWLFEPGPAPATIAEQRARLPPKAECRDPVEGKWKSHVYYAHQETWYEMVLEIERVEGSDTELSGKIYVHSWAGTPRTPEPTCAHDPINACESTSVPSRTYAPMLMYIGGMQTTDRATYAPSRIVEPPGTMRMPSPIDGFFSDILSLSKNGHRP